MDKMMPEKFLVDGNSDFVTVFVPKYLHYGAKVYDIGGGKRPFFCEQEKHEHGLRVVGFDIDAEELLKAPKGAYDDVVLGDITRYHGAGDADVVICQSLLEHVLSQNAAFKAISTMLKPGGLALVFVPSRNALFARLNLILPDSFKKKLLAKVQPKSSWQKGFPAYYEKCTPVDFRKLAKKNNFSVQEEKHYYKSSYFNAFFPAYLVWRVWTLIYYLLSKENAAETFCLCMMKEDKSKLHS